MEEYGKGYRFEDTVLIGVDCLFDDDGTVSLPVSISDAIAYNRANDIYLRGVESVASIGCPPMFPSIDQGSFVPDKEIMESIKRRNPRMALWTSQQVASFPHAQGFYAKKNLLEIIENAEDGGFDSLVYHERKSDGTLIGFGLYAPLLQMMSRWHDIAEPYVDSKLREFIRRQDENNEIKDLTFSLYCLGERKENDVLRMVLARKNVPDERILAVWSTIIGDKSDISTVKGRMERFREKLVSSQTLHPE